MLDSERDQRFMKIQEMRSAFPPAGKKVGDGATELYLVLPSSGGTADRPPLASELDEGRWSVVSFDKREAGGLKYDEAIEVMVELDSFDVNGLCIVTDSAAERIGN
jgi:hypothetical protein